MAEGGVHSGVGAAVPGHGLSGPGAVVPKVDVYPPEARNGMELKSAGGTGVPGTFSTKMYS